MPSTQLIDDLPTDTLYHYTSVGGLVHIVESKLLWATHVSFLNDAVEIRYAIRLLESRISDLLARATGSRKTCLSQLKGWLHHGFIYNHLLFVCSFTSDGNLLSQWRGYSPPGKGVSIGFNADAIVDAADMQQFYVTRCVYEPAAQVQLMDDMLNAIVATADDLGEASINEKHPTQSYYGAFERHEDLLLQTAARIKHPAFAEESEWRAISKVSRQLADPALRFREGALRLIPFVEFALPRKDNRMLALEHVYVGPSAEPQLAFSSVDWLLTKNGAGPSKGISASGLPWRTW
jgi:hypothetical protein